MNSGEPLVSAVILNWNNYEHTRNCILQIKDINYSNFDIVVVDNNSTDESISKLKGDFDDIEFIENSENLGFSGGMNKGIERALEKESEYIWVNNNDITIEDKEILTEMVTQLEKNPRIGAITPMIMEADDPEQIWFEKSSIDWKRGTAKHEETNENRRFVTNDRIPYTCVLFSADTLSKVGLLPEEYFLYYEDIDHCLRMRDAGYSILTDTKLKIAHQGGASSGGDHKPTYSYYKARNTILFYRKYHSRMKPFFWFFYGVWICKAIVDRILNSESTSVLPILYGMKDGFLHNSGQGPYPK